MPRPESEFPTIADLQSRLDELVQGGLGDLPVQLLVVPDSTLQAIARSAAADAEAKHALMIDLGGSGGRMAVTMTSVDGLQGSGMPSTRTQ